VSPGRWELSPGYSVDDPGFTRVITTSCLVCHNGQPDPQRKLEGIFKDCERYLKPILCVGDRGCSVEV